MRPFENTAYTLKARGSPRRLLCIAEAVTLAHVARVHVIAQAAVGRGYEVMFCTDSRYNALFGDDARNWRELYTIPSARFTRSIERGSPIYDVETLSRYIEDELQLIRYYAPDMIVGDFRLSLSISARLSGIPYINISNAYWSPYADIRYSLPDIPLVKILGLRLGQRLFDIVRPVAFAFHAAALNRARKRFGLQTLKYDMRHAYTDADLTLYADLPQIVPVKGLPDRHHFIGPLPWSPRINLPAWWNSLPEESPVVYVNLGSSGHGRMLLPIIEALDGLPVTAIVATAGMVPPAQVPDNVKLVAYLPGDQAAARASLVICNGGSPGCYQSLTAGRPILGIPHNMDQFLNMSLIDKYGAGLLLRSQGIDGTSVKQAVKRLLQDRRIQEKAQELQGYLSSVHAADAAMDKIEDIW